MAMQAAREMGELGLAADVQEAKITEMYAKTLKTLVDAGIASGEQAMAVAEEIENRFIDAEGGANGRQTAGQIPPSNPIPAGNMAGQPGNGQLPQIP
jgi:hypothetical protein